MAIAFDEIDDYYTIPDAAGLTLPDGDWCIGIWTYVSDNAGTLYQYLISTNALNANSSFNLFFGEATCTSPVDRNKWAFNVEDDDGTNPGSIWSTNAPGADSTWRLIVCQRNTGAAAGQEFELWFCEPGQAATKEATASDANFAAIDGGIWYIGAPANLDANRFYGSIAAEIFKGNFALSQAQIEALAAGLPTKSAAKAAGLTLDVYLPMWEADAVLLDYSSNGNDATRSSAPTTAAHPPICTPTKRRRM